MDNYEFCAQWAAEQGGTVLDFGCGAGQVVSKLKARGLEAYGCDTFFDGGDFSSKVPAAFAGSVIRRMVGTAIPFPDAMFDVVLSNQVMEHIPDLGAALAEMDRVLKPGGKVLNVFPYQGVWLEGHSLIPFLHWFGKGTRTRVYYMAAMSLLGFGKRKGRSRMEWCWWTCEYLDKWIHYRTLPQIHEVFGHHFVGIRHIEHNWLVKRVGPSVEVVPESLRRLFARKAASLVFICEKAERTA